MKLILNGEDRELAEGLTVDALITELGIQPPYAVEINHKVCPKKLHPDTVLKEGDRVEVVTIVGGG